MVYYRKYRPQTISQLDTDSVRDKLFAVFSQQSIPHAFLFTGPKGAGKTSAARIVAKAVNCEKRNKQKAISKKKTQQEPESAIEPCNECEQCVSITSGNNLDVVEIDGASNRGIDEMRDLREKVKLAPTSAQKKVYIIDEVHMLTTEAFNALLKTLEEPPDHVLFILCTTELHKVPVTILSRCFHVSFTKATNEELVRSLERIVKGEQIKIDNDALMLIAQLSGGGFRDAAKILEEMILLSHGDPITKEKIERSYHSTNISTYQEKLLSFLLIKETQKALLLIEEMAKNEIDMSFFIASFLDRLHALLLSQLGVGEKKSDISFSVKDITILSDMFTKAYAQTKAAVIPQLPLEIVVVEWTESKAQSNALPNDDKSAQQKEENPQSFAQPKEQSFPHEQIWKNLIDTIKEENFSLAGVLRGCVVSSYNEKELVLETKFKFHKERLEDPKAIQIIEQAIKKNTGNTVKIVLKTQ